MPRILEYLELVEDSEATVYARNEQALGMRGPYYRVTLPDPAPRSPEDSYMAYVVGNFNGDTDRTSQIEQGLGESHDGEFLIRRMRSDEIEAIAEQTLGPETKVGGLVMRRYKADEEQRIRQVAVAALCEVGSIC